MKTGKALRNEIDQCNDPAFWWLGQLGYVLKLGSRIYYFDVYLSDSPERNVVPLLSPEDLANADYIFGSHNHGDHIDMDVWQKVAAISPKPKFVLPLSIKSEISDYTGICPSRLIGIDDNVSIELEGVRITGVAAAHEFLDQDPKTGFHPYLGYMIETDNKTIFHSGDCCIYEGLVSKLKKWPSIDVMFLPINGRDGKRYRKGCIGNMTFQEAADLAGTLKVHLAVPGHYEMFDFNRENPYSFIDYYEAKYPDLACWIGSHGEKVIIGGTS